MENNRPQHPEYFRPRIPWNIWGRWHNKAKDRNKNPRDMLLEAMKEYLENHPRGKRNGK